MLHLLHVDFVLGKVSPRSHIMPLSTSPPPLPSILVVPDETLWIASYDSEGCLVEGPVQADRCPCFVGREYQVGSKLGLLAHTISHLEILTISGLEEFLKSHARSEAALNVLMPPAMVRDSVRSFIRNPW